MKKNTTGDIIILPMFTKNYDQMMYSSWDMVHNRWMDRWMDGQKKWHVEVGAPIKNYETCKDRCKLCHINQTDQTTTWKESYILFKKSSFLSNRWLWVLLDGKSSQEYAVNAGVPQDSILGPALFLLYINDLPDDVICNIAIYADDTTLYSKCH